MGKVGYIDVDAGICFVGDPCYSMPDDGSSRETVKDWHKFCELISDKDVIQLNHKAGHPGMGMVVSTGWGDGTYPVYIKRNSDGRVAEVRVAFDSDEEEDEN